MLKFALREPVCAELDFARHVKPVVVINRIQLDGVWFFRLIIKATLAQRG